jgi:DNA repair exonuclease SbcCD ATPase subunit
MRLVRLEAKDFAQHAELDLDLSGFAQAVVVGENGAGKSTLLDATVWCLYGRGTERNRSTDELLRDDRNQMWVRTTWDREGSSVVVTRSRSTETKAGESALTLHVDSEIKTQHTMGETQDGIVRLVGLDREQLLAGPFMEQGQGDRLMRYDPGPRKALFAALCGADRFEPWHETVKAWLNAARSVLAQTEGRMPPLQERVDRELEYARAKMTADQNRRDALAAVDGLTGAIEELREEAQSLREQAVRAEQLSSTLASLNRADEAFAAEGERLRVTLTGLEAVAQPEEPTYEAEPEAPDKNAIPGLEETVGTVATASRALANWEASLAAQTAIHEKAESEGLCGRCPYRGVEMKESEAAALSQRAQDARTWLAEHEGASQQLADLRAQAAAYQRQRALVLTTNAERVRGYDGAVARFHAAEAQLVVGRARMTEIDSRRGELHDETARVQAERLRLIQTDDRAKEVAAALTTKSADLTLARGFLTDAERALAVAEAGMADAAKARLDLAAIETEVARLALDVEAHDVVVRMFHRDGLPTMIVEATVPLVEERANELLDRMPGELAVTLVTQRASKVGKMSETLDVMVAERGRERPYGMLSGAERFRVDLALRLGLANVLLHRTGSKFETLWLDEPFAAQDRRALEALLASVAAVVDEFGLTLVVTHQQEVAERFPVRIEVTDAGFGTAEVRVVA